MGNEDLASRTLVRDQAVWREEVNEYETNPVWHGSLPHLRPRSTVVPLSLMIRDSTESQVLSQAAGHRRVNTRLAPRPKAEDQVGRKRQIVFFPRAEMRSEQREERWRWWWRKEGGREGGEGVQLFQHDVPHGQQCIPDLDLRNCTSRGVLESIHLLDIVRGVGRDAAPDAEKAAGLVHGPVGRCAGAAVNLRRKAVINRKREIRSWIMIFFALFPIAWCGS